MDLRSGYPLWPVLDGLLASWPPLQTNLTCDVAVLGGGISGALIADQLTTAGVDTILLDQREFGWGSTSASTALLQYDLDQSLTQLSKTLGEDTAARCYRAVFEAREQLDDLITGLGAPCGYSRRRVVYLGSRTSDHRAFAQERELRRRHGIQVELWNGEDLRRETGIERPVALTSMDAAQVDPYRLTIALLQRAATRGLRLFDRTRVTGVDRTDAGLLELRTDREASVTCRTLVRATGYETEQLLRQRTVKLRSTYAFASEPLADLPADFPQFWESARPYLYVRPTDDGRIIVGGEDDDFSNAERRDRAMPDKVRRLERKVKRLLPQLALEPAFYWAGTFAESDDSLPYIGAHQRHPRTLFALCYGGNGTTFAMLAASLIRDEVLKCPSPVAAIFGFDR